MTKKDAARWIECIANDKRVPKDVREMCADMIKQLVPVKKPRNKK